MDPEDNFQNNQPSTYSESIPNPAPQKLPPPPKKRKGVGLMMVGVALFLLAAAVYWFVPTINNQKDQLVGNDRDAHGCIGSAGYTWCEIEQKCLRVWEEECESAASVMFGDATTTPLWLSKRWELYSGHYEITGDYSIYNPGFDYNGNLMFRVGPSSYSILPISSIEEYISYFLILNDSQLNEIMGIEKSILGENNICGFKGKAKMIVDQYYYLPPAVAGKGGDADYAHVSELLSFSSPEPVLCR